MNKRSVPALVHQASGKVDYGSPIEVVNAARLVMGGIDLDVASAPYYNRRVKAKRYFHIFRAHRWFHPRENSLDRQWVHIDHVTQEKYSARVWMNHPYGRKENYLWIKKLIDEYISGHVAEACVLTFAEQSTKWGKELRQFPRWIPDRRLAHYDRYGRKVKGSVKGSIVTYIAPFHKWGNFATVFPMVLGGSVDIPAEYHYFAIAEMFQDGINVGKSSVELETLDKLSNDLDRLEKIMKEI